MVDAKTWRNRGERLRIIGSPSVASAGEHFGVTGGPPAPRLRRASFADAKDGGDGGSCTRVERTHRMTFTTIAYVWDSDKTAADAHDPSCLHPSVPAPCRRMRRQRGPDGWHPFRAIRCHANGWPSFFRRGQEQRRRTRTRSSLCLQMCLHLSVNGFVRSGIRTSVVVNAMNGLYRRLSIPRICRSVSRFLISARLSCCFKPLPSPSFTLTKPR